MSNNPQVGDLSFAAWLALQLQQTDSQITDFAKYVGVTRTIIYRWLGKTYDKRFVRASFPSPKSMEKILTYFDIPLTQDFMNVTRNRGWMLNRSRKKYEKLKKKLGSEYYPIDDQDAFISNEKVLTTKHNNEV